MELSDELLEEIGAYLSGRMTDLEKTGFENRMQNDESLRQEVRTQHEIRQGLVFRAQKERFKSLHADLEKRGLLGTEPESETAASQQTEPKVIELPTDQASGRQTWSYFSAAASVVLLAGLSWALYQNWSIKQEWMAQNGKSFDTFFSPALKPQPVVPIDPDRVAAPPDPAQTRSDSVRLADAITLLQQQDTRTAIGQLVAITQNTPGHWTAAAQWYLALAYLKAGQRPESRKMARQIAGQNGHPYQQEAKELIEQLPE